MQSRSPISRRVSLLLAALITIFANSISHAQETSYKASFGQNKEAIAVNVLVGQSRVINFDRPVGRFSVSNPDIAEAVLVTPDQVLVNGKAFGQVNFIAWEQTGGQFLVFDVYVRANLSLLDSQIRALFPKEDIRLSQANGSVVISGSVKDANTSAQVQSVIEAANFKTVNMLTSPTSSTSQVQLEVRVAEVNRNKLRDYGTSFTALPQGGTGGYINSGGGPSTLDKIETSPAGAVLNTLLQPALNLFVFNRQINTGAMLKLMRTEGAFRELAEPNLIAMNGQQASFLAGGEFPVPVLQTGNGATGITIVWKEYGVRLNFKPTIVDEDHIRLELEPEVSTIDFSNGVRFNGFVVPALRTRRAKTGVELRDGQSFALAGLLDNSETKSLSRIPLVSDIPVIGALFKSKSFEKRETELMFIVTAHMVKPVNTDDLPNMRGIDGLKGNSPLGVEPKGEGISGQTGFKVSGQNNTTSTPAPAAPAKVEEPKTKAADAATQTSTTGSVSSVRNINPVLPVAKAVKFDFNPESVRPW
ncbi:MAG TPA: type II and III secretion system protein family protein [Pyrinomonadaceae bacterium]|jgi:pilus assembly protein CpaC|nr:type II and III secretion system protein family protein [Pyrinomonadaceae bacterium]